jgi:hypothetical protein
MGSIGEDTTLPHLVVTVAALLVKDYWRGHGSRSTRSMNEEECGWSTKGGDVGAMGAQILIGMKLYKGDVVA